MDIDNFLKNEGQALLDEAPSLFENPEFKSLNTEEQNKLLLQLLEKIEVYQKSLIEERDMSKEKIDGAKKLKTACEAYLTAKKNRHAFCKVYCNKEKLCL